MRNRTNRTNRRWPGGKDVVVWRCLLIQKPAGSAKLIRLRVIEEALLFHIPGKLIQIKGLILTEISQ
jgi:hypothetical protein